MENEKIEAHQVIFLFLFAMELKSFDFICQREFKKFLTIELHRKHNDVYRIEAVTGALEVFVDSIKKMLPILTNLTDDESEFQDFDTVLTKEAYFEIWFTVMESVLPAVKDIESIFGKRVYLDGHPFSEDIQSCINQA